MPAYLVLVWWYLWGFGNSGCCSESQSASSSSLDEQERCCERKKLWRLAIILSGQRNPPPTPQPCASSWLTLDPEGAEVTDEASASAACLHFRLQPVQWRTGILWAQASGTCPDACWDSARVAGEVALESCGTCSLESWSWSCEDLKKIHWERRIMVTLFYKLSALVAPFSHSECKFPPTYQSSCFAFLSVVYSAVLQPWLKVFFYCFKLKGCPSDNTIPHLFTNTNTGVWAA